MITREDILNAEIRVGETIPKRIKALYMVFDGLMEDSGWGRMRFVGEDERGLFRLQANADVLQVRGFFLMDNPFDNIARYHFGGEYFDFLDGVNIVTIINQPIGLD